MDFKDRLALVQGSESRLSFAQRTGIGESSLRQYEQGSLPKIDKALAIAKATGVSLQWLIAGDDPLGYPSLPAGAEASDLIRVPKLDVRPSAGYGALAGFSERETEPDVVAFREDWLRRIGVSPSYARLMIAKGDSMFDTINDGDLIIVDVSVREIVDQGVYVLVYGGLVLLKRIQILRSGDLVLKSDNPRYEPEHVPRHEQPELIIEGRVKWAGGSL